MATVIVYSQPITAAVRIQPSVLADLVYKRLDLDQTCKDGRPWIWIQLIGYQRIFFSSTSSQHIFNINSLVLTQVGAAGARGAGGQQLHRVLEPGDLLSYSLDTWEMSSCESISLL